jgi:hypothetical protein
MSKCEVGVHYDRVSIPQRKDESVTTYLTNILLTAITYLDASSRLANVASIDDTNKLRTLPIHATRTKDVIPDHAYEAEAQEMIYNFGVYLEFKAAEIDSLSPAATIFAAIASQTEVVCILIEQVATLVVNASRSRVDRERINRDLNDYGYRNRDDNRSR